MPLVLRGWRKALLSINNHVYNPAGVLQGSTKSASKHLQAETALELKTTLRSGSSNSCMLCWTNQGLQVLFIKSAPMFPAKTGVAT